MWAQWPGHPSGSLDRWAELGLMSKMPEGGILVSSRGPAHATCCSWEQGRVSSRALPTRQGGHLSNGKSLTSTSPGCRPQVRDVGGTRLGQLSMPHLLGDMSVRPQCSPPRLAPRNPQGPRTDREACAVEPRRGNLPVRGAATECPGSRALWRQP